MDYWMIILLAGAVLAVTLFLGSVGIPLLKRLRVGQTVRDDGPASHKVKTGTPTFGGFFFGLPIIACGLLAPLFDPGMWRFALLAGFILLSGTVGFIDDFIKVRVNREGLSVRKKSALMLAVDAAFVFTYLYLIPDAPVFIVPVSQQVLPILGAWKLLYGLFLVVYLYFVVNAVNLTDGVDGLCSSVTVLASLALGACAIAVAPLLAVSPSALAASGVTAAGCLGFLRYNRYKARVIMGDTGSLALGASVSGIALLLGMPWLLVPAGIIYIAEAMSVVIQVIYFRKTGGRRIFRMSPIHHHFELGGWSEWKIVGVFSAVTLAGGVLAVMLTL